MKKWNFIILYENIDFFANFVGSTDKNWNISKPEGRRTLKPSVACHNVTIPVTLHHLWDFQLQNNKQFGYVAIPDT